jgi:hypothetical protein
VTSNVEWISGFSGGEVVVFLSARARQGVVVSAPRDVEHFDAAAQEKFSQENSRPGEGAAQSGKGLQDEAQFGWPLH